MGPTCLRAGVILLVDKVLVQDLGLQSPDGPGAGVGLLVGRTNS